MRQELSKVRVMLNGEPREFASGTTVAGVLAELRLDQRALAVERNLQVVPRARHAECILADGDRLEVVTLVGGG